MWAKVDDHLDEHKKVFIAGERLGGQNPTGRVLAVWLEGRLWSNRNNTLGFLPMNIVKRFKHDEAPLAVAAALAAPLSNQERALWHTDSVNCLWVEVPGGYRFHDDEKYRPKKTVEELYEARSESGRKGGQATASKRKQNEQQTTQQNAAEMQQPIKQIAGRVLLENAGKAPPKPPNRAAKFQQNEQPVSRYPDPGGTSINEVQGSPEKKEPALRAEFPDSEKGILKFRRRQSRGTDGVGHPKISTLTALARAVLQEDPEQTDEGDLLERIKRRCAGAANLKYDSRSVGIALDNARKQLAHIARRHA